MSQCTVTVKGKDKDKFDFLSKKFGQRAALQSLIEADETVSVPGFISEVEIGTRINAFAFSILNNLITKSSGASVINLVNTEIMPLELESAILAAKRDLEVSLEEILLKEDISEQDKYKATRIVVALKSFEDLRPKIVDRLNSYGLKMSETNNAIDDLLNDEESEETSKEHIYNMAHTERNPVDSIPPSVKLYLATLHDLTTDSMGQDTMKLDDIGMAVPVNFDFIYGKLLKNLADIATYEEMVAKIEELSEFDPVIRQIYSDLENDKLNGSVSITLPDGTKARTFENALFSAFKTTHNEFITVTHETVENEGVKLLKASVYPTNKRKQYKTILQRWATNASKIIDAPIESKVTAWNNTLSKVFYPYRDSSTKGAVERKKLYKARLNDPNNFNVLVEVSNALYYLGIDMTPDEVGLLRKEMNKKSAKFGDFIDKTIAPLAEKLWNKGDNIYKDEKGNLSKLSKTVASISNDISVETFINGENNQIYPINLPTYFSELFTALKSDTQVRRNYILDPLYTSFKFIRDFINGEEIQSASFDTIYNNDMNEGVPFDRLDPVSAMAARFSLFMNFNHKGDPDGQKGWVLPPTPSDRSGTSVVRMPKMQFETFSYSAIIDENSELMKWFTGVLEGEFQRIQRVRYEFNTKDKSDLIENYHYKGDKLGNGGFFNYYPDFNSLLVSDEAGFVEDIDFNSPEVMAMKKAVMEKIIETDVTYLSEIGFLEPVSYKLSGKLDYTSITPSEITTKLAPKEMIIDFNVLNFVAHSLVATHELSALASGDLAFFKAEEITPGDVTANLENANKRAGMAATPGRKLRVGSGGARSKFKVAFLKDVIVSSDSDYLKMLEGLLGQEMAAKYKKSNSTDGQGLVSLKRYAEILNGQGLLTPSLAQTINELQKPVDKINWDKVTEPLNPVKGFYHGLDFNSETESMEAHSLKYSLLPIFPAAITNNPTMQSLYDRMTQSNIDEAVFESGAKYGATKLNSLESNEPLKFIELSNHNWRVPQVVPYKTKTEENFGSQMRKLVMGNIDVTADYNGKTGQQLRDDYQKALSMKIERAYKKLAESISTNGKFNPVKIAGKIKEELARNSFKNVSDFLFKALEVSEGETRMPMSFPSIKGRIESSLNSMVRKAVNKLSLPGFVGVVYSSVGYSKNQIKYSQDLKMARLSEDGKTVLPAEIIASPQYFIQSLLKKRKELVKEYEKSKTEEPLNMEVNSSIIEVFEENPELSKIGTLEQYAQYLATVFPGSKLKEILYHWARTPFDVYDKSKREAASSDLGEYLNVSRDKEAWRNYVESNSKKSPILQRYLINLKNPYYTEDYYGDKLSYNARKNAEDAWFEDVIESTYDGIIENDGEQIAIFNEENILKLGSPKDIENFKNFVNSTSSIENDIKALDLAVSELKKGNFDIAKIPEDLRKVVTYRIPTQGKNSMMAAIIVGFTPESLGSTVTLPAEIVTQSGMDYDIDKIYLEIPHFDFIGGKFTKVNEVKNEVKTGVTELFESNPELAAIGNELQYSQYLETVFPNSKVKDIVYHGTTAEFDKFDKNFISKDGVNSFGDKFYFMPYDAAKSLLFPTKKRVVTALLNMPTYEDYFEQGTYYTENNVRRFEEGELEELAVNEPEQIHILGSKQDIDGFKEFIQSKPSSVKSGVEELFNENPELSNVGTLKQYSEYLDTIFPDSKVKDIVYHNTKEQFETFDKSKLISDGFYFTPDNKAYKHVGKIKMSVLLDLKNPITDAPGLSETINKPGDTKRFSDLGYDGIIDLDGLNEYIVFEPEQIHILGSKQDIQRFKKFVENTDTKSDVISDQQLDNIIIDTHYTVLTTPVHFKELMTPNNSDTLVELVKELAPEGTGSRYWGSLATQDVFRDQNQAGGVFIGIASIANTAHTVFQELGVRIKGRFDKLTTTKAYSISNEPKISASGKMTYLYGKDKRPEIKSKSTLDAIIAGERTATTRYESDGNIKYWKNLRIGDLISWEGAEGQKILVEITTPLRKLSDLNQTSEEWSKLEGWSVPYYESKVKPRLQEAWQIGFKFYSTQFKSGIPDFTQRSQEGIKINGVFVDSLSKVYSMNNEGESTGRYISDDHIEIQTAAVDNASNPLLGKLNINTVTGSTYLFLVEAGLGLKYPTYLVNTPIIKELVRRTRANEATMGPEAAFSNALSDLAKEIQIDTLQVESQDFDVTENILKDSIDQSKEGKNTTTHDAQILLAFLTFRKYAQEMHQVQSALKIDNIGPKQSLAANLIQQVELSKVPGTYSDSLESGVVSVNPADKVSLIELDRELYSKHSLENYEKYGLHGAIEATSSVIADGSPLVMEVVSKFQDITVSRLNEKDVRMLINDFYTYLFINAHSSEFGASTLSIFEGRDVAKLLLGKNSVGKRVVKAQKEDLLEAKKDITHTPNRFLQSLTVTLGEKRSGYDTVSFNNTLSKALSGYQKTMISNEYLKMFESENEELSELAQDLFLYNMFTEGFNSGIDSFSEYNPIELYESIENPETGKSLIEEFKAMVSNFTQPNKFDTDTFILRFLQNRGTQLQGLKDLRKLNIKALKKYLSTHPNVRYFIARSPHKSGFGIAKNLGKGFYNIVASPIGVKNVHVEYQSGNFISELTSSADVLNRALYSEDVIETENSTCVL